MDRFNKILDQAKKQQQSGQQAFNASNYSQTIKKFVKENRLPRIMIYAIIAVKITTIYDKIRQLVAINNIYGQIVLEQRENFREAFKNEKSDTNSVSDEELMQDLLTRRILQVNNLDTSDDDLQTNKIVKPDLIPGRKL